MSTWTLTFDRIGRNYDPPPLTVEAKQTDPEELVNELAELAHRHVRPKLFSRDFEVHVELQRTFGGVPMYGSAWIMAGFRCVGRAVVQEEAS